VCAIVWCTEDARSGDSTDSPLAGLAERSNDELLALLDGVLLELERRLLRYARSGAEFIQMADWPGGGAGGASKAALKFSNLA
jgi:hypothetical protein